MTKEEIDELLDSCIEMIQNGNNENAIKVFEKIIKKYVPGEDFEQAMQDASVMSKIIAKSNNELLDYFEKRAIDGDVAFLLTYLPEDRKVRILEKSQELNSEDLKVIIVSLDNDDLKERFLDIETLTPHNKAEIIVSIHSDEKKFELMQKLDNLRLADRKYIMNSIDDENIIFECLRNIRELSSEDKTSTILTKIKSPEIRMRAIKEIDGFNTNDLVLLIIEFDEDKKIEIIQETEDLDSEAKTKIICSIEDEGKRIEAMQEMEGLSSHDKLTIICSIEDEDKRIKVMQKMEDLDSEAKTKIICSIEDEDKRIEAMQEMEGLSSYDKLTIICSIEDEDKRIEVMQKMEGLSSYDKLTIICSIEDEDKRIEAMQEIDDLDSYDKSIVISSIKDEDRKIKLIQEMEGLNHDDKVRIICSIRDDDKKIEVMKKAISEKILTGWDAGQVILSIKDEDKKIEIMESTEDIHYEHKIKIISHLSPEKVKELMSDSSLPSSIWTTYRSLRNTSIDFIKDNLDYFLKAENVKTTQIEVSKSILLRMFETNNDVVKNIDFRILEKKYIETLGEERINLISCYPNIQKQILELSDKQLYLFDKCIDVYVEQNETDEWTSLASDLLEHIGEYEKLIESFEKIENLSQEDITDIARIMQSENWCEICSIEDVREYDRIKAKKCQEIMEDENATLEQKKQAVYQKIFGHDLSYAEKMMRKYGTDIENIDDCEMKDYIRTLKMIDTVDNVDVLQEIFEKCDFAELDKVLAERELKTEYGKKYFADLYVPQESDRQNQTSNIYEAGTEFKIILTSIGAYSSGTNIDNYKTDWNRPVISTQHFCASYIRNDMIGTAPIRSICYGFSQMKEDALMLSGTGDIWSSAKTFESTALHNERYFTPNVQIDNTSGYNEMDFRRIQGGVKLQPNYIIVFRRNGQIENMEEAQKASEQWAGMPIVIVDVDKCLEAERAEVDTKLAQYRKNPTPELAREITQKVRNNRQTDRGFCQDLETELEEIKAKVESKEAEAKEEYIKNQEEPKEESVNEEQLIENYKSVIANEREQGVRKIREIYMKIQEITRDNNQR